MFSVKEDQQGILWPASREGLNQFDPATRKFSLFPAFNPARPDVYAVQEDRQGQLWVGTQDGLYQFDRRRAASTRIELPLVSPDTTRAITAISVDSTGTLWIESESGQLYRLEPGGQPGLYSLPRPIHRESRAASLSEALFIDQSSQIWTARADSDISIL